MIELCTFEKKKSRSLLINFFFLFLIFLNCYHYIYRLHTIIATIFSENPDAIFTVKNSVTLDFGTDFIFPFIPFLE